ncbi:hypothetical protein [Treponema primitia]|uniref:hypothetical protein n=1 Tax=Treponema primitia TaxID=88058 RepID=UPI00059F0140|nr:hypothetical protein [Treponema primitia]
MGKKGERTTGKKAHGERADSVRIPAETKALSLKETSMKKRQGLYGGFAALVIAAASMLAVH